MVEPFFIFSSGRSGSTLLASMLNMHPAIFVPVELFGLYSSLPRDLKYFGDLHDDGNVDNLCRNLQFIGQLNEFGVNLDTAALSARVRRSDRSLRSVIESFYATLLATSGKTRIGDKTPNNSPYLGKVVEVFPAAKAIHLVRDGRNAALSSLRAREGINNRNVYELGKLWPRNNLRLAQFGKSSPHRYLLVTYEHLTDDPEKELRRICTFLEEEFCADLLRHESGAFARANAELLAHHTNLVKPVQHGDMGKWTVEMSADDVKIFEHCAGTVLRQFGYRVRGDFVGLRWRRRAVGLALQTQARRLLRFVRRTRIRFRYLASVLLRRMFASRFVPARSRHGLPSTPQSRHDP